MKPKKALEEFLLKHSNLNELELREIINAFQPVSLSKNEPWLKQGDTCKQIGFVSNGILKIFGEFDKEEITLGFVFKTDFCTSLSSFINETPSRFTIQAITDCQVLVINREDHFDLIRKYKSWLEVDNQLLLKAYLVLEDRMLSHIQLNSQQRYSKLFNEQPEIFNQVPVKHLASSLGISPGTLKSFRNQEAI